MELDLEAIRQSPRQFVDLETVIALSDRCMVLQADADEVNAARIYLREKGRLLTELAEKNVKIERLKEDGNMPVKYYQPNGKGQVYAVYGASSINFADSLLEQLAASQAREVQLREALHYSLGAWYYDGVSNEHGSIFREANDRLTNPPTHFALETLIAQAGEVMRERCAHEADPFELKNALATDIAKGIRALPDVTLEDLK